MMTVHVFLTYPQGCLQQRQMLGAIMSIIYGSTQSKGLLGAFGLHKSKSKASQSGFLFLLCFYTWGCVKQRAVKLDQPTQFPILWGHLKTMVLTL